MNTADLIQAISAGICFYAGIVHLMIGLRSQPRDRVHLTFAAVALLFGIYSVNLFMLYTALDSGSLARYVFTDRWGIATNYLAIAALFWFIAAYTGARKSIVLWVITGLYVLIALSNFILPYPWVYADIELTSTFPPEIVVAPWYSVEQVLTLVLLIAYPAYHTVRQYRRGERGAARALGAALGIFLFTILWDYGIEYGLLDTVLVQQYGFVAFIVIMSLRLASQYVEAMKESRRLNAELDQRVVKRTAELSSANQQLQQEIGEREQVAAALKGSEERYALAQRAANIGSWDWDIATGDLHWSDQIEPMFGFGPGEFGGTYEDFLDSVHLEDRPFVIDSVDTAVQQGAEYDIEHRIVWPDGSVRWVSETGDVFRDQEGQAVRMVGAVRDITARRQAENTVQERVKELNCLYGISALIEQPGISLEEILQGTVDLIPPAWQCPEITCARIVLDGQEYRSERFRETAWKLGSFLSTYGECSGSVEVYQLEGRPQENEGVSFLNEERSLLDAIAERVSRVGERYAAEEARQRRVKEMSTLHRVAQTVAAVGDLSEGLEGVAKEVTSILNARGSFFSVLDVDKTNLEVVAGFDRDSGALTRTAQPFPLDQMPVTSQALEAGQRLVLPDVQALPLADTLRAAAGALGFRACLLVPLKARGDVIGLLAVGSDEPSRTFTTDEVALAETIAGDVAAALENAKLAELAQAAAVGAERQRMARELHDSVTQSLYSLTLLSKGWGTMAAQGRLADPVGSFQRLNEVGQQALKEMRLMIHQLRPPILEEVGLVGALRQRLEAVEQRANVEARLLTQGDVADLPGYAEEQLYQITREALNNALRHGAATEVIVRIEADAEEIQLLVEDNGTGFDASADSAGMGLTTMQERAEAIGGQMTFTSAPDQGTTIEVVVALGADEGV